MTRSNGSSTVSFFTLDSYVLSGVSSLFNTGLHE